MYLAVCTCYCYNVSVAPKLGNQSHLYFVNIYVFETKTDRVSIFKPLAREATNNVYDTSCLPFYFS